MSDPSTTEADTASSCPWCGESFQPGDATQGVHAAGLDSSRLSCPHQDLERIAAAQRARQALHLYDIETALHDAI